MARYFFHVMNGVAAIDNVGVELNDIGQVRREAIRASGQMLSDADETWTGRSWQMFVTDESSTIVFSTEFMVDDHGF